MFYSRMAGSTTTAYRVYSSLETDDTTMRTTNASYKGLIYSVKWLA